MLTINAKDIGISNLRMRTFEEMVWRVEKEGELPVSDLDEALCRMFTHLLEELENLRSRLDALEQKRVEEP